MLVVQIHVLHHAGKVDQGRQLSDLPAGDVFGEDTDDVGTALGGERDEVEAVACGVGRVGRGRVGERYESCARRGSERVRGMRSMRE